MSETRRPDATMTLRAGDLTRKYELYQGSQFAERAGKSSFFHAEQPNLMLTPLDIDNGAFVRVRCNGVWLPKGRRAMFPLHRAAYFIAQDLAEQLRDK